MQITNLGHIAKLTLPPDWTAVPPRDEMYSSRFLREFRSPDSKETSLCFFYRGAPVGAYAGEAFCTLLNKPPHNLDHSEYESLREVLDIASDANSFRTDSVRTMELNGKKVLALEGQWLNDQHESYNLFLDTDGTGRIVQQIFFSGPKEHYLEHLSEVQCSLSAIEWLANA